MPSQIEQNDGACPIDSDPLETQEWRDALQSLLQSAGPGRAREVLTMLSEMGRDPAIADRKSVAERVPLVDALLRLAKHRSGRYTVGIPQLATSLGISFTQVQDTLLELSASGEVSFTLHDIALTFMVWLCVFCSHLL